MSSITLYHSAGIKKNPAQVRNTKAIIRRKKKRRPKTVKTHLAAKNQRRRKKKKKKKKKKKENSQDFCPTETPDSIHEPFLEPLKSIYRAMPITSQSKYPSTWGAPHHLSLVAPSQPSVIENVRRNFRHLWLRGFSSLPRAGCAQGGRLNSTMG